MLSFVNDYSECAHEAILKRFLEINLEKNTGYGYDKYSISAEKKIREAIHCPDAKVFFLAGGTQTNQLAIDSMIDSYGGVITADTGHINVHESGAVEFTGHKVIPLPSYDGKMKASDLAAYMKAFYEDESYAHMVIPQMVYMTHPTEVGTLYTLQELKEIYSVCQKYKLPLYLDGARLGYGLGVPTSDVTLPDIAKYTDAFYIGGTKVGALFGEALVFTKNNTPSHFMTRIKQHGDLLAKGFLVGMQFDVLFTDDLYTKGAQRAIALSDHLREELRKKNYEFFSTSPTNQIFIVLDNGKLAELKEKVGLTVWGPVDESHTAVRFVVSWATTREEVDALIELM